MTRTMVLVLALLWGSVAWADELLLETYSVSELLGEAPAGLSVEGAQLWNGTLGDLAEAVAALEQEVALVEGVDADTSVTLVSNAPVPATLAGAAVGAACRRLTSGEAPGDLQVMITVVEADQVEAMAALQRRLNLLGTGTLVEEAPDSGAVIVVNTEAGMDLPPDPEVLLDMLVRRPAEATTAEGVEEIEEGRYRVERAVVAPLLDRADRSARIVPSYSGGELEGFKLFSIRPASAYNALKIRNGDVLMRVDGATVEDIRGVEALLKAWLTRDEVRVTVRRRGQETQLVYEMVGDAIEISAQWSLGPPTRKQYLERFGVVEEDEAIVLPREYVLSLRNTLAEDLHWRYVMDDAGEALGLQGNPRDGNLLHVLGLDRRDYLTAVGDSPVTNPRQLMEVFTALRLQSVVELTVAASGSSRVLKIRVEGEPDPDQAPWPLPLLDVAPTLGQKRAALGIVEGEGGVLSVPRELVLELLSPLEEVRLIPTPPEAVEGYKLQLTRNYGRLAPLGLNTRDTVVAVDGDPVTTRAMAEAVFGRMLEADSVTLTKRRRGREDETIRLDFVGAPVTRPDDWAELSIEPTLDERRAEAGIRVEGARIVIPRQLVLDEGHDLLRWLPAGEMGDGYVIPRRSRSWLTTLMGLRTSDVVLSFDGRDLDSDEDRDALVDLLLTGDDTTLSVMRDHGLLELRIGIEGAPAARPAAWSSGRGRPRR